MDVRAYKTDIHEPLDTSAPASTAAQLNPLRIERIAPSVLIALFDGEPQLVILEEPYHGIPVPTRLNNRSVVRVLALRDALEKSKTPSPPSTPPVAIEQSGSAAFAISVLDPPWRQRFEGTVDHAGEAPPVHGFLSVSQIVQQFDLRATVTQVLGEH